MSLFEEGLGSVIHGLMGLGKGLRDGNKVAARLFHPSKAGAALKNYFTKATYKKTYSKTAKGMADYLENFDPIEGLNKTRKVLRGEHLYGGAGKNFEKRKEAKLASYGVGGKIGSRALRVSDAALEVPSEIAGATFGLIGKAALMPFRAAGFILSGGMRSAFELRRILMPKIVRDEPANILMTTAKVGMRMGEHTVYHGAKTARWFWDHRKSRTLTGLMFGVPLAGMTAYGFVQGSKNAQMGRITADQSSMSKIQGIQKPKGLVDDYGADGSLVFALNNLRKGGYVG